MLYYVPRRVCLHNGPSVTPAKESPAFDGGGMLSIGLGYSFFNATSPAVLDFFALCSVPETFPLCHFDSFSAASILVFFRSQKRRGRFCGMQFIPHSCFISEPRCPFIQTAD